MTFQSRRGLLLWLLYSVFTELIEGVTMHACVPADLGGQPSINLVHMQPK